MTKADLIEKTNAELRDICRSKGLTGYSKKTKSVLIEMILSNQKAPSSTSSSSGSSDISIKGLEVKSTIDIDNGTPKLISVEFSVGAEYRTWPVKPGTKLGELVKIVAPIMNIDPNIKSVIIDGKDVSLDFVLTNSTSMDVTKKTGSKG